MNKCGIAGCTQPSKPGSSFCEVHQPGERPKTSQQIIDVFTMIVDSQDEKGLKKYGESIDQAKDEEYEWNRMALEEAVDGMKYLVKENQKLREELMKLKRVTRALADSVLK